MSRTHCLHESRISEEPYLTKVPTVGGRALGRLRLVVVGVACAAPAGCAQSRSNDAASEASSSLTDGISESHWVPGLPLQQRRDAARVTAEESTQCNYIVRGTEKPGFYWEIGGSNRILASGSVGLQPSGLPVIDGDTRIPIASSTKWVTATYVIERLREAADTLGHDLRVELEQKIRGSKNTAIYGLRQTTGCYLFRASVPPGATLATFGVTTCDDQQVFKYGTYSFEWLGQNDSRLDLPDPVDPSAKLVFADLTSAQLSDSYTTYASIPNFAINPNLAGGGVATPRAYATMLQSIVRGELAIGDLLGQDAACTTAAAGLCARGEEPPRDGSAPLSAVASHYSYGSWIEDWSTATYPADGAFSSAGAFGFYPWIGPKKQLYGVVGSLQAHRAAISGKLVAEPGATKGGVRCGQVIRRAFFTGQPVGVGEVLVDEPDDTGASDE